MKFREALIAWTPHTDRIRVGPLIEAGERDWTESYEYTGGAAFVRLRRCKDQNIINMRLFTDFHAIVVRDKVPVAAARREFLKIYEYRQLIAPDIPGADLSPGMSVSDASLLPLLLPHV
jgi:hypothetical protein